jgi:AcrR family transcriptional regulator
MSSDHAQPKVPKRERGKQRVALLLDAAAAVFTERGYEAATMTEIAVRAGAAIGSLYQFFPSKQTLAEALFDRYTEHFVSALHEVAERAPGSSPTELAELLVDMIGRLRVDRVASAALSDAIGSIVERRKPLRDALRAHIASILRAANPELCEREASIAAVIVGHSMKIARMVAEEEESSVLSLISETKKMLAAYLTQIILPSVRLDRVATS